MTEVTDPAPTRVLWVSSTGSDSGDGSVGSPFLTIQAAVNQMTPGTAVMVKAGTYHENVFLPETGGTAEQPIWLISADGPGEAVLMPDVAVGSGIIGFGTDHVRITDFAINGGKNGVLIHRGVTDTSNTAVDVVISGNIISNTTEDGIKVTSTDGAIVIDNTISSVGEEGVDFLDVHNGVIARNEVANSESQAASIFAKGGSTNVLIANNYVHGSAGDGISVGGNTEPRFFYSGYDGYEASGITVTGNLIEGASKSAISVRGAIDSEIYDNYLDTRISHINGALFVTTGAPGIDPPPPTHGVEIHHNTFTRDTNVLVTRTGSSVDFHDNRTDGVWSGDVGPVNGYRVTSPVDDDAAPDTVIENAAVGTLVGITAHATDADADAVSYSIVNSSGEFVIDEITGVVRVAGVIDYEAGATRTIMVRATSTDGSTSVRDFVVAIGDVDEGGLSGQPTQGHDRGALALHGAVGSETIDGLGGDDEIYGHGGNDTLKGNTGNDTLDGGAGADLLDGGAGTDTASYAAANTAVRVYLSSPTKNSGDALGDTYISIENVTGSRFNDSILGNNGANRIEGGAGNDTINGQGGDDLLLGGTGNDTITGSRGLDTIEGGAGNDILTGGSNERDTFLFRDTWNDDRVTDYEAGIDVLDFRGSGLSYSDLVVTQVGADVLISASEGQGTVRLTNTQAASVTLLADDAPAADPVVLSVGLTATTLEENMAAGTQVGVLSAAATTGSATGFAYRLLDDAGGRFALNGVSLVTANGGFDFETTAATSIRIQVTDSNGNIAVETFDIAILNIDEAPAAIGVANLTSIAENTATKTRIGDLVVTDPDNLAEFQANVLTVDDDRFIIEDGVLYLRANQNVDFEAGSIINLSVSATGAGSSVTTRLAVTVTDVAEGPVDNSPTQDDDQGARALQGTPGVDTIDGLGGNDEIYGLGGNDVLKGGQGNDRLEGGQGADTLDGGAGIDEASYANAVAAVRVYMSSPTKNRGEALGDVLVSIENLVGSRFDDALLGNNAINRIEGGAGDDNINGQGGADTLMGGIGSDVLTGSTGQDILEGGEGDDTLTGGLGERDWFVFSGTVGHDRVTDFELGRDLLDFRGSGVDFADLTITAQGSSTLVSWGDGVDTLLLDGVLASMLRVGDFVL